MSNRKSLIVPSQTQAVLPPTPRKSTIYDRNLSRKSADVSLSAFSLLFSEIVSWQQSQSTNISDLETRLSKLGYRLGVKLLELISVRLSKTSKRDLKIVDLLLSIHSNFWKLLFDKPADAVEKSQSSEDEYMIIDSSPMLSKYMSVPRELGQLNCNAFMAGVIEGALDASYFPADVTAHTDPIEGFPQRTVYLIKFRKGVVDRERVRFLKKY